MFGKDNADCPLWRGPCRGKDCRWHTHVMGKNPQSNETINKTGCAIEFLPILLIENSQQTRQTGASIDRFNDDMVRMNGVITLQRKVLEADDDDAPLIEAKAN